MTFPSGGISLGLFNCERISREGGVHGVKREKSRALHFHLMDFVGWGNSVCMRRMVYCRRRISDLSLGKYVVFKGKRTHYP